VKVEELYGNLPDVWKITGDNPYKMPMMIIRYPLHDGWLWWIITWRPTFRVCSL
jgi:hypothetical protein